MPRTALRTMACSMPGSTSWPNPSPRPHSRRRCETSSTPAGRHKSIRPREPGSGGACGRQVQGGPVTYARPTRGSSPPPFEIVGRVQRPAPLYRRKRRLSLLLDARSGGSEDTAELRLAEICWRAPTRQRPQLSGCERLPRATWVRVRVRQPARKSPIVSQMGVAYFTNRLRTLLVWVNSREHPRVKFGER